MVDTGAVAWRRWLSRRPTRSRRARRAGLLAVFGLILSACVPLFPEGSQLFVAEDGPFTILSWDPAVTDEEGEVVEYYTVDVDGTVVATITAPTTDCVLIGLTPEATTEISIYAHSNGQSSGQIGGDSEQFGYLRVSHTSAASAGSGLTAACVSGDDSDGDRLPDAVETNTGVFVDAGDTGTDPAQPDTDGDGIGDGDEVLGTASGLDLPALGAGALRADLLMEFDWFDDNNDPGTCGPHSHRPTAGTIAALSTAFADASVANPDGSTGLNLIADYGQGGAFTGGNLVPDADGVIAGFFGGDYATIKASNFAADRSGYFRYTLLPHRYDTNSGSSGLAEMFGDDLIVSLNCLTEVDSYVTNTIMHEVGHNVGLRHGGDENLNWKPNYNSVMNYRYQFSGIDTDCNPYGDAVPDYSDGSRATLDENALDESVGLCGGVPWDWNNNLVIDPGLIAFDINVTFGDVGDGVFGLLRDVNDWPLVNLSAGLPNPSAGQTFGPQEVIAEQPVPMTPN